MDARLPGHFHFEAHPSIEMADLLRLEDPVVICEGDFTSVDGEPFWVYTIGGTLDGARIEMLDHVSKTILGATVGGDVMIIHGRDRKEADWLAINGLMDTIASCEVLQAAGGLEPGENSGIITETQVRPKAS
jgi:hypothetical protein